MVTPMSGMRAELQILEVERKMLAALDKAWEHYEQCEGPPPMQLTKLMKEAHDALLKRLVKRIGLGSATVEDLRSLSIELAKEQSLVQQMIEQQDRGMGLH